MGTEGEDLRPWVRVECSTIGCTKANGHLSECATEVDCDGGDLPDPVDVVGVRVIVTGCVECSGGMALVRFTERAGFESRCLDCGAVVPPSSALYCP